MSALSKRRGSLMVHLVISSIILAPVVFHMITSASRLYTEIRRLAPAQVSEAAVSAIRATRLMGAAAPGQFSASAGSDASGPPGIVTLDTGHGFLRLYAAIDP